MNIVLLLIFMCLTGMIIQDIRYRHIHILLPVTVFFSGVYILGQRYNFEQAFKIICGNSIFILLTIFILTVYMSLKNKLILNPFKNYFGLGDLLFYIAISPCFILYDFIVFFILSLIFVVILHYVFKKFMDNKTIPLAGYASLFVMFILVSDIILKYRNLTLITAI